MLWAVTSAVPVATAVILPQLSTRTMLEFDVAHVTPRSAFAGSIYAESCAVCPGTMYEVSRLRCISVSGNSGAS